MAGACRGVWTGLSGRPVALPAWLTSQQLAPPGGKSANELGMATMATMATPKSRPWKKMKRGVEGVITNQLLRRVSRFFFGGWPAGVAMVAMVATGQKSP